MGLAAICARKAATGSAGGALVCWAWTKSEYTVGADARKSEAGKRCATKALPARVAESRSIARREVGFRKQLECMRLSFRLVFWVGEVGLYRNSGCRLTSSCGYHKDRACG